jgi:hypothetical protein
MIFKWQDVNRNRSKQLGEKRASGTSRRCFVTGHSFSQADKAHKMAWASAPAECFLNALPECSTFSPSCRVVMCGFSALFPG